MLQTTEGKSTERMKRIGSKSRPLKYIQECQMLHSAAEKLEVAMPSSKSKNAVDWTLNG